MLKVGDTVKVHFPAPPDGFVESPWAEVVELLPDGTWRGRIANWLLQSHGCDYGDVILFEEINDGRYEWFAPVEQCPHQRPH